MTAFEDIFGSSPTVFLCLTVILVGGCAAMAGQALAKTWRPAWHALPYALLLGAGDRFLVYALFHGRLTSLPGYLLDSAVLLIFCLTAYRATRAGQMANQYPWLYERRGWFTWRERNGQ